MPLSVCSGGAAKMAVTKIVDVGTADAVWFKYLLSCIAASCAEFGKSTPPAVCPIPASPACVMPAASPLYIPRGGAVFSRQTLFTMAFGCGNLAQEEGIF